MDTINRFHIYSRFYSPTSFVGAAGAAAAADGLYIGLFALPTFIAAQWIGNRVREKG